MRTCLRYFCFLVLFLSLPISANSVAPGVSICSRNYNCGAEDGICPKDYGAICGAIGTSTCDPDCGSCTVPECVDNDKDGYGVGAGCLGTDCLDLGDSNKELSAKIHPGAIEACNDLDDDCDGVNNEGLNCLSLTLSPDPVVINNPITATVTGATVNAVKIKDKACTDSTGLTKCTTNIDGICTFTAASNPGVYIYYACKDAFSHSDSITVIGNSHCSALSSHANSDDASNGRYMHSYSASWSVVDCTAKESTDTDGQNFKLQGTAIDFTQCDNKACGTTTYTDSCTGSKLTEYTVSSSKVGVTAAEHDCAADGTPYCSNDRYMKNEWACSSGACIDAADTRIGTNADNDEIDKECGDNLCDNAAGVYNSTKTATETSCNDGLDNDCDGATDGADSSCAITLTLNPNPAEPRTTVTASVSGPISGTVLIKDHLGCADTNAETICSFSLPSTSCTFTSPTIEGDYGYNACSNSQTDNEVLTVRFTNISQQSHCSSGSGHSANDNSQGTYSHRYIGDNWQVENCGTVASLDSDGSASAYTSPGTVTDYSSCSSGACTGATSSDSCSGTTLTEYAASGSSVTSTTFDCQALEADYCSASNRYFRREYGCSGNPGACNDAAFPDTAIGTNADNDAKDRECGDSNADNADKVYDDTQTCIEGGVEKLCKDVTGTKNPHEFKCNDGLDNDADGAKDCADSDCGTLPACSEICNDKIDNDFDGKTDCLDSSCQSSPLCCTTITRDCKSLSEEAFKKVHKEYYEKKKRNEKHEKESTILRQIVSSQYYACEPKIDDVACCSDSNSCVYNGVCYPDKYKMDVDGDGTMEICVVASPGKWTEDFETDCADGTDNDRDGATDCQDSDCAGTVGGTITDQITAQPIPDADIDITGSSSYSAITDGSGNYNIPSVLCGNYNFLASHVNYAPAPSSITLQPSQNLDKDAQLVSETACETDCTYASDNIVHGACDNINGCDFYDDIAKSACDNSQPGWARPYSSTHYVVCSEGAPQPYQEQTASVNCPSGTLVKSTSIAIYKGQPVKLVVVACG